MTCSKPCPHCTGWHDCRHNPENNVGGPTPTREEGSEAARPSRGVAVLSGLPADTNQPATFAGRQGFWVQGDCVFIADAPSPAAAINTYRRRMASADCGVYHNHGTAAVGLVKANTALATTTAEREALRSALGKVVQVLQGLCDNDYHEPENEFKRGVNHERRQNNRLVLDAATTLGYSIDLNQPFDADPSAPSPQPQ